ncbi:MAG: RES domain-containing protein [Pseudomonadota bacterium]
MNVTARCYRAHDPSWSFSPTSGEGARIRGGRFNVKGTATLYLTFAIETAVAEWLQSLSPRLEPMTICEYDVDCDDILDLTDPAVCKDAGIDPNDLACGWLSYQLRGEIAPSQKIAQDSIDRGAAGIIVPSFAPGASKGAKNLVLWSWGNNRPHKVMVYDPNARLPKDRSSWS